MTSAFKPRARADAMPGASVLLEITTEIRASGMRPRSIPSAIATKFDPRPERRMPRFFMRVSADHHTRPRTPGPGVSAIAHDPLRPRFGLPVGTCIRAMPRNQVETGSDGRREMPHFWLQFANRGF